MGSCCRQLIITCFDHDVLPPYDESDLFWHSEFFNDICWNSANMTSRTFVKCNCKFCLILFPFWHVWYFLMYDKNLSDPIFHYTVNHIRTVIYTIIYQHWYNIVMAGLSSMVRCRSETITSQRSDYVAKTFVGSNPTPAVYFCIILTFRETYAWTPDSKEPNKSCKWITTLPKL